MTPNRDKNRDKSRNKARKLTFIAMSGALSALLMVINFPIPLAPSFMKFDLAELPALFIGFFLSTGSGCAVVAVKILVKLLFQGSETAFVGEAVNLASSLAFVLPAAALYRRSRAKEKSPVAAMAAATALGSAITVFLNAYIAFPAFAAVYGIPMEALVKMGSAVNPLVHDTLTLMLYAVLPFNLFKHGVTALAACAIYRRCNAALQDRLS